MKHSIKYIFANVALFAPMVAGFIAEAGIRAINAGAIGLLVFLAYKFIQMVQRKPI